MADVHFLLPCMICSDTHAHALSLIVSLSTLSLIESCTSVLLLNNSFSTLHSHSPSCISVSSSFTIAISFSFRAPILSLHVPVLPSPRFRLDFCFLWIMINPLFSSSSHRFSSSLFVFRVVVLLQGEFGCNKKFPHFIPNLSSCSFASGNHWIDGCILSISAGHTPCLTYNTFFFSFLFETVICRCDILGKKIMSTRKGGNLMLYRREGE